MRCNSRIRSCSLAVTVVYCKEIVSHLTLALTTSASAWERSAHIESANALRASIWVCSSAAVTLLMVAHGAGRCYDKYAGIECPVL